MTLRGEREEDAKDESIIENQITNVVNRNKRCFMSGRQCIFTSKIKKGNPNLRVKHKKKNYNTGEIQSSEIGNLLRETCAEIYGSYEFEMDGSIAHIRSELIKLIRANDNDIYKRKVPIIRFEDSPTSSSSTFGNQ